MHLECNKDAFDFSGIKREAKSRGGKGSFVQIALYDWITGYCTYFGFHPRNF